MRAFLNGRIDLTQAEAIADLIAVNSEKSKQIALHQLRGGFSSELSKMRTELIDFAALLELELDFSEEDVEFADRKKILNILNELQHKIRPLIQSFKLGNAIKNGIPVAIVGKPNSGKSTLLNALLNEERAIVSDIAGTTRDTIEDTIQIDGILYRFIDTAGLRNTEDTIEHAGIERAKQKIKEASIILFVADINEPYKNIIEEAKQLDIQEHQELIFVLNKIDTISSCDGYDIEEAISTLTHSKAIALAAKDKTHLDKLKNILTSFSSSIAQEDTIINNIRHYESLKMVDVCIDEIRDGVNQTISNELIALDLRRALQYIGEITGEVEIDRDILGNIFGKFCIGK
jgi:tRNA modification GTPase